MNTKSIKKTLDRELEILHVNHSDVHEEIQNLYEIYGNSERSQETSGIWNLRRLQYEIVIAAMCTLVCVVSLRGYAYAKNIDLKHEISQFFHLIPEQEKELANHFQAGTGDVIASETVDGVTTQISEVFYTKQTFLAVVEVHADSDVKWNEKYKFQDTNVKLDYKDDKNHDLYEQGAYSSTTMRVMETGEGYWKGYFFCDIGNDIKDVEQLTCSFDTFGQASLVPKSEDGYVETFTDAREDEWNLQWKVDYAGDETVKEINQVVHCAPYVADWKITKVYLSPFSITCEVEPVNTDAFERKDNGMDYGEFIRGILWSDGKQTSVSESEGTKPGTVLNSNVSLNEDKTVGTATIVFNEVQNVEQIRGIVLTDGEEIIFQ